MAYVAIQGGAAAIRGAADALEFQRTRHGLEGGDPLDLLSIGRQLSSLQSRVLSEGGVYHPELANLAIKQSMGDTLEAAFTLRAYRSTRPRLGTTAAHDTDGMRLIRRVSAAFKDIPGGQHLGPTRDYSKRLLRFELADEDPQAFAETARAWLQNNGADAIPPGQLTFPRVVEHLRAQGLLPPLDPAHQSAVPMDITREALVFPLPRSGVLSVLSRGETGGVLAMGYSVMRSYGDIHPTIAELRVGYLPVQMPHPITGEPVEAGEVLMTECQVIAMFAADDVVDGRPSFGLGYGCCFGHNEHKAIAMAMLDRSLIQGQNSGVTSPNQDQEFVLLHVDGIESMGFCNHYKLPHYVTFQSDLDRLRQAQKNHAAGMRAGEAAEEKP
ncbi:MAG: carbon-phosphorus lyase [Planctomycetota bacterium]|nr:MAG: carbon-phosphorus lyase [Planctomycetota bacterium]